MDVGTVPSPPALDPTGPVADPVAVAACRRVIVARAAESVDHILELVAGAIFRELPEYGTGRSRGEVEDIRSGMRASIELCLWTVGEARAPSPEELAVVRATGGQRARQGVSRPALVASVRTAVRVGRAYLMGCGDLGHDADVLLATHRGIGGLLDRFEDHVAAALAEGWDDAHAHLLAGGDRGGAILVDRLLARRFHDEEEVLAHAAEVGLGRASPSWVVVVARPTGDDGSSLAAAVAALGRRLRMVAGPTCPTPRLHVPVVVQPARDEPPAPEVLERVARETGVVLVVADEAARLTSLAPAYAAVCHGLPYLAAATDRPGVLRAVVLRFHHALCAGDGADWPGLVEDVLRPLEALAPREAADLLEALDGLVEVGTSGAELARHLHLHKNTVNNRLRRAEQVLGLDLRRPAERLVVETVMRLRRVVDVGAG